MKRRDFVRATLVGGSIVLPGAALAQDQQFPPAGFFNSKVAIGRGVYAEPKGSAPNSAQSSKVPGTMVSLTAAIPNGVNPFWVTLFVQARSGGGQWQFVPCRRAFTKHYQYLGYLRDIAELSANGLKVTLFVPDAAHDLQGNNSFDLRPIIRFYTLSNELIAGLDQVLPHETVKPQFNGVRRAVEFYRGDENPPFEIFDVSTRELVRL